MKIVKFEDILAWQKAKELTDDCYKYFRTIRDFCFRDQILRAVISIMNNIAEGFERKGNKEFKQFLFIAKGSSGEVRSMLYIAKSQKYITEKEFDELYEQCVLISRIISGFIKVL